MEEVKILSWKWLNIKSGSLANNTVQWFSHPRACLGYSEDSHLVVVEGRRLSFSVWYSWESLVLVNKFFFFWQQFQWHFLFGLWASCWSYKEL